MSYNTKRVYKNFKSRFKLMKQLSVYKVNPYLFILGIYPL